MNDSTNIAPRPSVSELVAVYERAESEIRAALSRLQSARDRLTDVFGVGSCGVAIESRYNRIDFDDPDSVMTNVARQVWRSLVEQLELRRMMSVKAWGELEKQLAEGEVPPITRESVAAMAQQFRDKLPDMLAEAVTEVYEWLRPHEWDRYKTNKRYEIGQRVILTGVVEPGYGNERLRVRYWYEPRLTALENVFTALDGKGQVTRGHWSAISQAIKTAGFDGKGTTDYIEFKAFLNGNLHLKFRRLDLLEKLNAIAGGKRLKGSEAA